MNDDVMPPCQWIAQAIDGVACAVPVASLCACSTGACARHVTPASLKYQRALNHALLTALALTQARLPR